ncbi:MAG: glycosyltransferase [Bdellovibrionota bacterium]
MSSQPRISIIMGAYNAAATIHPAVESILKQSVTDWEFIICDDGSKDTTWSELQKYSGDPRFVLLQNEKNMGLAGTLNVCLKSAKAELIARQDADDTSTPNRFAVQLDYLEKHPDVDVVSTNAFLISEGQVWGANIRDEVPQLQNWVRGSQIIHASAMMKKEILLRVGGYNPLALRVEDYDLWMRMLAVGAKLRTVQEKLYFIQWGRKDYGRKKFADRLREVEYKLKGIRSLKLGPTSYLYLVKPLIMLLIPGRMLFAYHQLSMGKPKS